MLIKAKTELGPSQKLTDEGFLICYDVPVARTGDQQYAWEELVDPTGKVKLEPDDRGLVTVERNENDVFDAESMSTFNMKPIVIDHPRSEPGGFVTPENWERLAVGVGFNVRRGEGENAHLMYADFMIWDIEAIEAVMGGLREVSNGYDALYVPNGKGRAIQRNIRGNHFALVRRARCGSECAIGDSSESLIGAGKMKKWFEEMWAAFRGGDEAKFKAAMGAMPARLATMDSEETDEEKKKREDKEKESSSTNDARFKALDERMDKMEQSFNDGHKGIMDSLTKFRDKMGWKDEENENHEIEGELKEEAPVGTGDAAISAATDSSFLSESHRQTASLLEIIAPGARMPVFDSKENKIATFRNICDARKKALKLGLNDSRTNGIIEGVRNGRALTADSIDQMPCGAVRTLFLAVGSAKKEANNRTASATGTSTADAERIRNNGGKTTGIPSLAEVQKRNRELYK